MKYFFHSAVRIYLENLARLVLLRYRPKCILITGTAGKTTTKSLIFSVLKMKFGPKVMMTYGSMGTKVGLPLALLMVQPSWIDRNEVGPPWWQWPYWLMVATGKTIFYLSGIARYPEIWVAELTADKPGDFASMLSYIQPTVAVVTNIGPGHLEYFGDEEGVAREKETVVRALSGLGYAVLNWHDPRVQKMAEQTQAKVYWVRAEGLDFGPAAARIVGRIFGMKYEAIQKGLATALTPDHRFEVIEGPRQTTIIDSSYNANPVSMIAALERAAKMSHGRLIAVLGDMLELGSRSSELHRQVGVKAKRLVTILITIGTLARDMGGHYHARDMNEAMNLLNQFIKPSDTIVIKASHGMRLDRLVEKLKSMD